MYVYLFDGLNVLSGPADIEVPGLGRMMPSNGIELEEPLPEPDLGKVWGLVDGTPVQLVDHRGVVYNVVTGEQSDWVQLGELPDEYTLLPFPGGYHVWDGVAWVADAASAAKAQRDTLVRAANQATVGMTDAFIAGLLSDEDTMTFKAFAAYKLALSKIEQQPGYPTSIDWPTSP